MRAERVDVIEATREPGIDSRTNPNNRRDFHEQRPQRSFTAHTPPSLQLKIAERPVQNRVRRLLDLADSMLKETETLARDKEFTDESNRVRTLNLSEGIDFYAEVTRFEAGLIRLALDQTGGHQARAARLLRIKPTTLNSKIKLYGIEY
jgi:transcriptional regulator with GAF, ATPase, and Fis domain